MGKNKNKNTNQTASPEAEAKRVMLHAKSNNVDVFSSTVDLGEKGEDMLKCLSAIHQEMGSLSVILISAGEKQVLVGCLSVKSDIKVDDWVASAVECIPKSDQANTEVEVEEKEKFKVLGVFVGGEGFPIKEKESALANSFSYLKKNNLVPDDESSDDEMAFNLNNIDEQEPVQEAVTEGQEAVIEPVQEAVTDPVQEASAQEVEPEAVTEPAQEVEPEAVTEAAQEVEPEAVTEAAQEVEPKAVTEAAQEAPTQEQPEAVTEPAQEGEQEAVTEPVQEVTTQESEAPTQEHPETTAQEAPVQENPAEEEPQVQEATPEQKPVEVDASVEVESK